MPSSYSRLSPSYVAGFEQLFNSGIPAITWRGDNPNVLYTLGVYLNKTPNAFKGCVARSTNWYDAIFDFTVIWEALDGANAPTTPSSAMLTSHSCCGCLVGDNYYLLIPTNDIQRNEYINTVALLGDIPITEICNFQTIKGFFSIYKFSLTSQTWSLFWRASSASNIYSSNGWGPGENPTSSDVRMIYGVGDGYYGENVRKRPENVCFAYLASTNKLLIVATQEQELVPAPDSWVVSVENPPNYFIYYNYTGLNSYKIFTSPGSEISCTRDSIFDPRYKLVTNAPISIIGDEETSKFIVFGQQHDLWVLHKWQYGDPYPRPAIVYEVIDGSTGASITGCVGTDLATTIGLQNVPYETTGYRTGTLNVFTDYDGIRKCILPFVNNSNKLSFFIINLATYAHSYEYTNLSTISVPFQHVARTQIIDGILYAFYLSGDDVISVKRSSVGVWDEANIAIQLNGGGIYNQPYCPNTVVTDTVDRRVVGIVSPSSSQSPTAFWLGNAFVQAPVGEEAIEIGVSDRLRMGDIAISDNALIKLSKSSKISLPIYDGCDITEGAGNSSYCQGFKDYRSNTLQEASGCNAEKIYEVDTELTCT